MLRTKKMYTRDICKRVKLTKAIQYSGVFSIHFSNNHNLATPLSPFLMVTRGVHILVLEIVHSASVVCMQKQQVSLCQYYIN